MKNSFLRYFSCIVYNNRNGRSKYRNLLLFLCLFSFNFSLLAQQTETSSFQTGGDKIVLVGTAKIINNSPAPDADLSKSITVIKKEVKKSTKKIAKKVKDSDDDKEKVAQKVKKRTKEEVYNFNYFIRNADNPTKSFLASTSDHQVSTTYTQYHLDIVQPITIILFVSDKTPDLFYVLFSNITKNKFLLLPGRAPPTIFI